MKPQTRDILALLRERGGEGVTAIDALAIVGSFRLAARIAELRAEGYRIESRRVPGQAFDRYVLVPPQTLWEAFA